MAQIEWELVPPRTYVSFKEIGAEVYGRVVHYSPQQGETQRDNTTPCGFVDLDAFNGKRLRVSLDKPSLTTQVSFALPKPGDIICIRYVEEVKGSGGNAYKRFEVFRALNEDAQEGAAPEASQETQASSRANAPTSRPPPEASQEAEQAGIDAGKFESQCADFKAALGTVRYDKIMTKLGVKDLSAISTRTEAVVIYTALKKEVALLKEE